MSFLSKMNDEHSERELKRLLPIVKQILDLEDKYSSLTDEDLFSTTEKLKKMIENGTSRDEIMPHAFAACREATYRKTGKKQYPAQILAAIAMENDAVAEMLTGQGKSLVVPLKAYLDSLYGKVNIVTSNDYLAERDSIEGSKIFSALGVTTAHISKSFKANEKKLAYKNDIVYSTIQQLGFDYLRDNLAKTNADKMMVSLDTLIIDEMDSVLFDQGMTPLVLSGENLEINETYLQGAKVIADMLIAPLDPQLGRRDAIKRIDTNEFKYYEDKVDFFFSKDNIPVLTESGIQKIESFFGINATDEVWIEIQNYVTNALSARDLKKDDRYIVQDGKIVLIDKNTDRKLKNNSFSYGLHQALEAKEGLKITPIKNTDSSITISSFIKKFKNITGTSGTAYSEYDEFITQYGKSVVKIPHYLDLPKEIFKKFRTKLPKVRFKTRIDHPTIVCDTQNEKYNLIIKQIIDCNLKGQPVLIGTTSIEESELINNKLNNIRKTLMNLESLMKKNNLLNSNYLTNEQKMFVIKFLQSINEPTEHMAIKHLLENSNNLNDLFKLNNANLNLLNAKNDKVESYIIANAGKHNSITISTNMAGRGTDISLGGSTDPDVIAMNLALEKINKSINNPKIVDLCLTYDYDKITDPRLIKIKQNIDNTIASYKKFVNTYMTEEAIKHSVSIEKQKVMDAGGLFVIGSSYHNSRRINDQLRGRAGRQTDKGESLFFTSLEDSILSNLDPNEVIKAKQQMKDNNIKNTSDEDMLHLFEKAQKIRESNDSVQRQTAAQFDSYIDICRTGFHNERNKLLNDEIDVNDVITNMVSSIINEEFENAIKNGNLKEVINEYIEFAEFKYFSPNITNKKEIIMHITNRINELIYDFDDEYKMYSGNEQGASNFKKLMLLDIMDKNFQEFINNDVEEIYQQLSLINTGGANKDPKTEFSIMLSNRYDQMTFETRKKIIEKLIERGKYYHNKNEKLGYHTK